MIELKYIIELLEKNAAIHGEAIKKTFKFVKKHPWLTIGGIGLSAGAVSSIGSVSKSILPTYHILNEQRKKGIMDNQTSILKKIEGSLNKSNIVKNSNIYNKPLTQPLA
jgi:hypothetical protein